MILVSVIIGYLLGVLPFLVYFLITSDIRFRKKDNSSSDVDSLLNEWLNGKPNEEKSITPNDLYEEYITGKESTKKEIK